MAIGDYSKTTYANGVAPAINATNLNNNENKVKELDTAVESIETWADLIQGIAGDRYHKNVTGTVTDQSVDWNTLIENGSYSIIGGTPINGPNGPAGLYGYGDRKSVG